MKSSILITSYNKGKYLEQCILSSLNQNTINEGEILVLKGIVEVDDYRTNDLGSLMYRMRVKEIHTIDSELIKKINEVLIDIEKSDAASLEDFSERLTSIDKDFWNEGSCNLNVKVIKNESEATIDLGDDYEFSPTLENLFSLEDIFGKNIIEI